MRDCRAAGENVLSYHTNVYSEGQEEELRKFIDQCAYKYKIEYIDEVTRKIKNSQSNKEQEQELLNPDKNYFPSTDELKFPDTTIPPSNGMDTDPIIRKKRTYLNGGIHRLNNFSDYLGENCTYSAADIVASINIDTPGGTVTATLGRLQTISYSIYQEKAPVRVLGNINVKDWVFGPRTIAGSLIFAVFNKHWLIDIMDEVEKKSGMKNAHFICDEIPPFDITISFGNEYGFDSRMALYGVRLMKEGQVMSVSDIYIENTYEFVANDIELMNSLYAAQTGRNRHHQALISAQGKERDYKNDDYLNLESISKIEPIRVPDPIKIPAEDLPEIPDIEFGDNDAEVKK